MSDKTKFVIECDVVKIDQRRDRYQVLVAAYVYTKIELDARISEQLKLAGYSLVYSSDAVSVESYLSNDNAYHNQAEHLCELINNEIPIQLIELHKIDDENVVKDSYLIFDEQAYSQIDMERQLATEEKWQPWISDELKTALFAQPDSVEHSEASQKRLHTYLIVDATLRKKIVGHYDFDIIMHCEVKCLFKGKAAQTLKNAAPYLIDITLSHQAYDDDTKVSKFHKDFIENHWQHNTGIIVRSYASMDEILHHYRRFTKVQNAEGEWIFFRFWDPNILIPYLTGIQHWQERVALWFNLGDGVMIESVMACAIAQDTLVSIAPEQSIKDITQRYPVEYTQEDFEVMEVEFFNYRNKKIVANLLIKYPKLATVNEIEFDVFLVQQIEWLYDNRIFEISNIVRVLNICSRYECAITDSPSLIQSLLTNSTLTEPDKIELLEYHANKVLWN
jgi:hypothetical protein